MADQHRPTRERRTAKALFEQIDAQGRQGSYPQVVVWLRRWSEVQAKANIRAKVEHPFSVIKRCSAASKSSTRG